jgi:hypothetical protein
MRSILHRSSASFEVFNQFQFSLELGIWDLDIYRGAVRIFDNTTLGAATRNALDLSDSVRRNST